MLLLLSKYSASNKAAARKTERRRSFARGEDQGKMVGHLHIASEDSTRGEKITKLRG
jgi:hypothetical protein